MQPAVDDSSKEQNKECASVFMVRVFLRGGVRRRLTGGRRVPQLFDGGPDVWLDVSRHERDLCVQSLEADTHWRKKT